MKRTVRKLAYSRPAKQTMAEARKLNQGIRKELRDFSPAVVEAFVRSAGSAIGLVEIMQQYASETARRANLERLQRATQTYQRELERPVLATEFPASLTARPPQRDAGEHFYRARQAAMEATREVLWQTEHALRRVRPASRGRRKADASGLLAHLAARYLELFGVRPTSTPGGTFANVAALVLENLYGTIPRDVTRQVRAAIKSL